MSIENFHEVQHLVRGGPIEKILKEEAAVEEYVEEIGIVHVTFQGYFIPSEIVQFQ